MSERTIRLPPLNALRVFHAVMRHRSFRSAADDLLVSPQAVSQQIKQLEETTGVQLFERKGRTVEPTENAILLGHYVQSGFAEFAEGIRRISKTGQRDRININASPYFATRYLLEKLGGFRDIVPGADLRLTTMVELPDFARDDVDVAIQWGFGGDVQGSWKNYETRLLTRDVKVICCTPDLARQIASPADLLPMTLLHPVLSGNLWADVLDHMGVAFDPAASNMRLQDAATMRRATVAGLGVGLLSIADAEEDLKLGRLVAPFGREIMTTMPEAKVPGFYLVVPKAHQRVPAIAAFCKWLEKHPWRAERLDTAAITDS